LTHFPVKQYIFTIVYADPDIGGKRVGDNNNQLLSLHWPGYSELIIPTVTPIVVTTMLSIANAEIAGLPDPGQEICELWGYPEQDDGDSSPYTRNVTPISNNSAAAGRALPTDISVRAEWIFRSGAPPSEL
jgi:hypothetical protein